MTVWGFIDITQKNQCLLPSEHRERNGRGVGMSTHPGWEHGRPGLWEALLLKQKKSETKDIYL